MSTYAIGDLQGCVDSFDRLAETLPDADRYIFVGDLVNRGPRSVASLRRVKALVESGKALTIFGNHDLHLLAVAAGIRKPHRTDTLQDILDAPDRAELLAWIRTCPLAHTEAGYLFVHAGVLPSWTVSRTLELAREVERRLAADDYEDFLREMYGNEPSMWSDELTGHDRLRCVVNALTRMRLLHPDGRMDLKHHGGSDEAPGDLMPWFDHPERATRGTPIVFGHWSTEGLVMRDDLIGIDTGCLWGGCMTAMRLEDRAIFQVDCPQYMAPGAD